MKNRNVHQDRSLPPHDDDDDLAYAMRFHHVCVHHDASDRSVHVPHLDGDEVEGGQDVDDGVALHGAWLHHLYQRRAVVAAHAHDQADGIMPPPHAHHDGDGHVHEVPVRRMHPEVVEVSPRRRGSQIVLVDHVEVIDATVGLAVVAHVALAEVGVVVSLEAVMAMSAIVAARPWKHWLQFVVLEPWVMRVRQAWSWPGSAVVPVVSAVEFVVVLVFVLVVAC